MSKFYLAHGAEPDGIKYEVWLKDRNLICEVKFKDKFLTKTWPIQYLPRAGWDQADVAIAENVMEELITQLRAELNNAIT